MRFGRSLLLSSALSAFVASTAAGEGGAYDKLLEGYAPSLVTVTMVVKTEMSFGGQSQSRESREEHTAVVVDAAGLVMLDYQPFASTDDSGGQQFSQKRTPTELKLLFDGTDTEFEAELVATDKKLGLAFVKAKDLAGFAVKPVAFGDAADVDLGAEVLAISRLAKGFDYAPYVETAKVNGRLKKPRKAIMIDNPGIGGIGLPVFTLDGKVVGAMVSIESGIKDENDDFAFFMRMAGGGQRFLLPGKVVAAQIELALKQAAEAGENKEGAAPAEPEKKEGG